MFKINQIIIIINLIIIIQSVVIYPSLDLTLTTPSIDPVQSFQPPNNIYGSQPQFGSSSNGIGDINDDGSNDFAFGSPFATPSDYSSLTQSGAIFIIWGKLTTSTTINSYPSIKSFPNKSLGIIIYGSISNQYFGYSISGNEDINNDNIDDIIIGCNPTSISNDGIFVIFGRDKSEWKDIIWTSELNGMNGFKIIPGVDDGWSIYFGSSSSQLISDYNNDGYNEILIGDYYADSNRGRSVMIYGRGSSWPSIINITSYILSNDAILFTPSSSFSGNHFLGWSIGSLDFNIDGKIDIIIGAYGAESYRGHIHVIWGGQTLSNNITLPVSSIDQGFYFKGPTTNSNWGYSICDGDINGDNNNDLIFSGYGTSKQVIVVISTNTTIYSLGQSLIPNSFSFIDSDDESFGCSISSGDINGDKFDDIFIGAYSALSNKGRVYIWYGKSSMNNNTITSTSTPIELIWSRINGNIENGYLGISVGVIEGYPGTSDHLIIGAYYASSGVGIGYIITGSRCKIFTSKCISCFGGYGINETSGECISCENGKWSDGTTECKGVSIITGCEIYDPMRGKCMKCLGGYSKQPNSDGTIKCEMIERQEIEIIITTSESNITKLIEEISKVLMIPVTSIIIVKDTPPNIIIIRIPRTVSIEPLEKCIKEKSNPMFEIIESIRIIKSDDFISNSNNYIPLIISSIILFLHHFFP